MPLISDFFGIKVFMYWNDHMPMHFHVKYAGLQATISIETGHIIRGLLPAKQLRLIMAWHELHKQELVKNWHLARENKKLKVISPLK